jgi:hypothetical protein
MYKIAALADLKRHARTLGSDFFHRDATFFSSRCNIFFIAMQQFFYRDENFRVSRIKVFMYRDKKSGSSKRKKIIIPAAFFDDKK